MTKYLTSYFENYDDSYLKFENEGINKNNILLETVFQINKGIFFFNSKSFFNKCGQVSHEYKLLYENDKDTVRFSSKDSGEFNLEAEKNCFNYNNLSLFSYCNITLLPLKSNKTLLGNLMLRFHHNNNILVSLGTYNWNMLGSLKSISAYGSFGSTKGDLKSAINAKFVFDIEKFEISNAQLLINGTQENINGYVKLNYQKPEVNKTSIEQNSSEKQFNNDSNSEKKVSNLDLTIKLVKQVQTNLKAGISLNYNLDSTENVLSIYSSKSIENFRINTKFDSNNTITFGFTHENNDITLGFTAENKLLNDRKFNKDGIETKVQTNNWIGFNYGFSIKYNRI